MNIPIVGRIGAILGALGAAGIYFEPKEPDKPQIVAAGTLRGLLGALLTGLSMSPEAVGWRDSASVRSMAPCLVW